MVRRPLPPLISTTLGARIAEAYRNAGFPTRTDFANASGLSYAGIMRWEKGMYPPGERSMGVIADTTGYTAKEIRGDTHVDAPRKFPRSFHRVPWEEFLKTEQAQHATPLVLAALARVRFPLAPPDLAVYLVMLSFMEREAQTED